jgi:hypothetical protein
LEIRKKLTYLPKLPNELTELNCSNNLIQKLPKLPTKLEILQCYNNKLQELPHELPDTLRYFNCSNNNIDTLPLCLLDNLFIHRCNCRRLPYDIHENKQENITKRGKLYMCKFCEWNVNLYHNFIYESNPIHKTIMNQKGKNKFGQKTYIYLERMKKNKPYVLKIEEWFLDCKYNPKYKYCKDRLLKEYKELYEEE